MINTYTLQMFAEGGAEGGATSSSASTSETGANNQTATGIGMAAGNTAEGTTAQVQSEPETFESLIKGKYKDDFDKATQRIINKRFREVKSTEENYAKLQPVMQMLSDKYNTDNIDGLVQAITNDNSFYEAEALAKGIPVEDYKKMRNLEMQNNSLRQQQEQLRQEAQRRQEFERIVAQVPDTQKIYPNFNLSEEMQNPNFIQMVKNGVPVKTAYFAIHNEELEPIAMQAVAKKTAEAVTNSIKANQSRPSETTLSEGNASFKIDISKLTAKDFEDIQRRTARGEKFTIS